MPEPPARDAVFELLGTAESGLRDQTARLIEQHFSELESAIRPRLMARQQLNEHFSRMRRADSQRAWCEALLDAAGALSRRCAFFSVRNGPLIFQGCRGIAEPTTEAPDSAALFEANEPVASASVTSGDRLVGVLYAQGVIDESALELCAALAGAVLDPAPVRRDTAHSAAQRFAQAEVARLLLAHRELIAIARSEQTLYASLRQAIDGARALYRAHYPASSDYLHTELVTTLATGDAALLGRDYPGPLA